MRRRKEEQKINIKISRQHRREKSPMRTEGKWSKICTNKIRYIWISVKDDIRNLKLSKRRRDDHHTDEEGNRAIGVSS